MSGPTVSVLLVIWNSRDETRRCLDALWAARTDAVPIEVVAVDNASTDGSAELLAGDPRVRLIRNERNVGYAAAVNQAYRQAGGELILLLTSAVRLHPGALDTMVGFLRDRADAAGVSPRCLHPDATERQHHLWVPSFPAVLAVGAPRRRLPGFRSALDRPRPDADDLSGARPFGTPGCLLLRRQVLEPDGILDERFPLYGNDLMLARSLWDAGHRLRLVPEADATRGRGASDRLLGTATRTRHRIGGLVRYLRSTEPRHRLAVFRLVLLADHLGSRLARRPTALGLRELGAALRGDVGVLPDGDTRAWSVLSGDGQCAAEHYFRIVTGQRTHDQRTLLVHRPRRLRGRRLRVQFDGASVWHATPPVLLPFGRSLAPVRRINRWYAAATVRRWLHDRPGVRVLRLDDTSRYLLGRIGEDEVVPATATRLPALPADRRGRHPGHAPLPGAEDPLPSALT
ncbi:hypothetical protein C6361_08500 [Plantactinospora sp. BC1]|uniref:glycosyltransferase family 2 protein n=1 Tax=Plantactinospora sp. BC1 TaxID=2108470 RepID=UPI000D171C4D|nr:glycosyltransferase family 2 protein [Plantactinospora sp. BC1]AVT29529.1 hypothetical protein C6361_08500 [Plantactinospora sp. BC1]